MISEAMTFDRAIKIFSADIFVQKSFRKVVFYDKNASKASLNAFDFL